MREENLKIRRGDIFYILPSSIPVIGSEQRPGLPGIVVSDDTINDRLAVVEIVYTTTRIKPEHPTHTLVTSTQYESTVLCEQIVSVSIDRLGNRYGRCTQEEMEQIDKCLKYSLALYDKQLLDLQLERDMYKSMYEIALKRLADVNVQKAIWSGTS